MRKINMERLNKIVSFSLAFGIVFGLAACGTSAGTASTEITEETVTETAEETEEKTEEEKKDSSEADTVATVIDIADVAEDTDGNIIDAVSHKRLTDEEIEDRIKRGVLVKDEKTGKITIVEEKNVRKAGVTVDAKTNKIISAEGGDGTSYKIDDGKVSAPGNKGEVKVDVKKEEKKEKAEVSTQSPEKKEEKKTEAPKKEEKKTEAPKKEEKKTEAPKKEEKKTEAPKKEEKKTETPKKEEKKTEAPKKEEKKTEAPKKEEKKTEAPKKEEKRTEAPVCSHNWVWKTRTETVHKSEKYLVSDAWDEPVYENHSFCNGCGCDLTATYGGASTDGAIAHLNSCGTGYHSGDVQVGSIHHEAEYYIDEWDEEVTVNDYQYCSKCGERR